MADHKLVAFLDDSVPGCRLWFCRGPGKCTSGVGQGRKTRCADCILPDEGETLEQVAGRIERGDG